jgi:hypothetical protein
MVVAVLAVHIDQYLDQIHQSHRAKHQNTNRSFVFQ